MIQGIDNVGVAVTDLKPSNVGRPAMGATIPSFSRDDEAAEIAAALRRDGAAIVRELVAADVMGALTEKVAPALEKQTPGGGSFMGRRKKSLGRLFARGREFSEHLLLNRLVLEVADAILLPEFPMEPSAAAAARPPGQESDPDNIYGITFLRRDPVLGPNCHHYRVNVGGVLQVWRGGTHQPLHREMDIYRPFLEHSPEQPEYILAVNWAGTDFTSENGATRIALGSHLWPQVRKAQEHEVAQAVMPKGSVLLWLGKTLHGLGASRSDEPRTGILFTFVVNWLTQEENQYLAVPPEIARVLPERAQQLLGYRSSSTLGWVPGCDRDNMLVRGKSSSPLD
jgi:hypothetical protein